MTSLIVNAVAVLRGDKAGVGGIIKLSQDAKGGPTTIKGKVTNVPVGKHGFHVHQFGDLSNGCLSAGAHFNPHQKTHGGPDDENRHAGDLGNVDVTNESEFEFTIVDKQLSLIGVHSIIGRSMIMHSNADDLGKGGDEESKKTGNAGPRMMCGVVGIAA